MNYTKIILILLFCSWITQSNAGHQSLCEPNEDILFSCTVKKSNKIVSLCASKNLSATQGYIQYRFGNQQTLKFIFPSTKIVPSKVFQGRAQAFSGGGGVYLRFKNKKYDYILHSGIGKGWNVHGLVLLKDSKFYSYLPCDNQSIFELTPSLLHDLGIPVDHVEFFPGDIPAEAQKDLLR